ncbi:MAG: hypothetical protein N2517_01165 [Ignavibacteria bacterium]|nr:hypothetical protein [Ignavibacteria bacterium]
MDPSEYRRLIDSYGSIQLISDTEFKPFPEFTKIAAFSFVDDDKFDYGIIFFNYLTQIFVGNCDLGFIDEEATFEDLISLRKGIEDSEVVIFAFFVPSEAFDNDEMIMKINDIIEVLAEGKPTIGIFFSANHIPEELNIPIKINLPTIENASIAAAAMYLAGRKPYLN